MSSSKDLREFFGFIKYTANGSYSSGEFGRTRGTGAWEEEELEVE